MFTIIYILMVGLRLVKQGSASYSVLFMLDVFLCISGTILAISIANGG